MIAKLSTAAATFGIAVYSFGINTYAAEEDAASAVFAMLCMVFYCLLFIVGIGIFIWTIMMIIDVSKRKNYENQTLWLVLLVAGLVGGFSFITTPLYYFLVEHKLGDPTSSSPIVQA